MLVKAEENCGLSPNELSVEWFRNTLVCENTIHILQLLYTG